MNDEPLLKRSSTNPADHADEQVYEVETLKERTYNTQTKYEVGALLIQYLDHSAISAEELVKRILDTS